PGECQSLIEAGRSATPEPHGRVSPGSIRSRRSVEAYPIALMPRHKIDIGMAVHGRVHRAVKADRLGH
ncbi:MAG: hypothetical protein ACRDSE_22540, partial [Pseudonocardiaceae bacterium]